MKFDNPEWLRGYGGIPQHPLYRTTANDYGKNAPNVHTSQVSHSGHRITAKNSRPDKNEKKISSTTSPFSDEVQREIAGIYQQIGEGRHVPRSWTQYSHRQNQSSGMKEFTFLQFDASQIMPPIECLFFSQMFRGAS